jgi:myosin-6
MDMCEMSLDQTGLIRKKGAEILAHQFEHEWYRHGGPNYLIDAGHARL